MNLTYEQLSACAKGALVKQENADGSILLRRMTEAQCAVYPKDTGYYNWGHDGAGIAFDFYTDSPCVTLTYNGTCIDDRPDLLADVLVDGRPYASTTQFSHGDTPKVWNYGPVTFPFLLPKGEKRVTVLPPHYVTTDSLSVELADGASFRPYTHSRRLMAFGDSITQGFSAPCPSLSYLSILGRKLDAEVFTHAIAGERFNAKKITGEYPAVDLVTVAYGTNDFGHKVWSMAEFEANMPVFFARLHATYPETPTFVLLPLWRADECEPKNDIPTLQTVRDRIRQEAEKYPNVTVIDCRDFIPHQRRLFADAKLHPNADGMAHYAENLYNAISEVLL